MPPKTDLRSYVLAAALAALTAVGAWIAIPVTAVPITLQGLFVYLAGLLLRPRYAALSMALYVVMGLIGLPVFAQGGSGPGVLLGPTGGYLVGFVVGATTASTVVRLLAGSRGAPNGRYAGAAIAALVACSLIVFSLGASWGKFSTGLAWPTILTGWILPFLPGDAVKMALATIIAVELRRRGILVRD